MSPSPDTSPVPCALCGKEAITEKRKGQTVAACWDTQCGMHGGYTFPRRRSVDEWNRLNAAIHAHAERRVEEVTDDFQKENEILRVGHTAWLQVEGRTASAVSEAVEPLTNALTPLVRRMKAMTDYADCECPPEGHFCGIEQAREELREAQAALAPYRSRGGEGEQVIFAGPKEPGCICHETKQGIEHHWACSAGHSGVRISPAPSGADKEGE